MADAWRNRIVGHGEESPTQLVANPRNWRKHPQAQAEALGDLITSVGWVQDVIVNRHTGRLLDGHLRVALALKRGELTVPVKYVDLSESEESLVLATFDPLSAMAEMDTSAFDALLRQVSTDSPAVQKMLAGLAQEAELYAGAGKPSAEDPGAKVDQAEELRAQWQTERGQVWEIPSQTMLGKAHRLMCGDSTSADDVRRLMAGQRAVFFATDPPYLVDYDGTNHPHKWNAPDVNKDWSDDYHDWDNAEQGEALYDGFIAVAISEAITDHAAWYCWHASRNQAMLEQVWQRHGAFVHQQIVWVKDRPVLTRSWYMWQHEPCFFGWVKGQKPKRAADDYPPSVWTLPTIAPGTSTPHPTMKPVEVFAIPMRQHTEPGELCYEPFSGSGTQIVAGEQTGRVVYAMELQPQFVAVALQRLADMELQPRLVVD